MGAVHSERAKKAWETRRANGTIVPWNKGVSGYTTKGHSEETKKKISDGHKGIFHTQETKDKISAAKRGGVGPWRGKQRLNIQGSKHYKWIEDRAGLASTDDRDTVLYDHWRISVFRRDKFKCKLSGLDCNGRLEAHHIKPWKTNKEDRYDIRNGIALCRFHHPRKCAEVETLAPLFTHLISRS